MFDRIFERFGRGAMLAGLVSMLAVFTVGSAGAGSVDKLAGRWSGWGAVKMSNGSTEQLKCIATYFVKNSGGNVDQNLRCASASYSIDAKANYIINGEALSGSWEERKHSARGAVNGKVTNDGFRLSVKGDTFSANMIVTSSKCKQSISIRPQGLNVSQISIGLRKSSKGASC
ncbi:MAG: hypothetical protein K0U74_07170 [Alphaproteobacteria bacterium]|nr:hypothetical protein [Alphaproteobacteria bacterium]